MATPIDPLPAGLVRSHLEAGIAELDRAASEGRYNTMCIRHLGSAAVVLGEDAIAERAARLLRAAPDGAFWAGAITNIQIPATAPDGMRTLDSTELFERRHPLYRADNLIEEIRKYGETERSIALCLERRFEEARAAAESGLRLEEVGETLAVLGEFDEARSIATDPALEGFRQEGVRFVITIELYRLGRVDEADSMLAESGRTGLSAWERVHLALAFGGRVPWCGYPYPDW